MIVELKSKSQMTIPMPVVKELGLTVGDKFDVVIDGGNIVLVPVVVYPKARLEHLNDVVAQARQELQDGETEVFSDIEKALAFLHDDE